MRRAATTLALLLTTFAATTASAKKAAAVDEAIVRSVQRDSNLAHQQRTDGKRLSIEHFLGGANVKVTTAERVARIFAAFNYLGYALTKPRLLETVERDSYGKHRRTTTHKGQTRSVWLGDGLVEDRYHHTRRANGTFAKGVRVERRVHDPSATGHMDVYDFINNKYRREGSGNVYTEHTLTRSDLKRALRAAPARPARARRPRARAASARRDRR